MNIFWLVALVVFIVVEAATVGLASVWFAVGSAGALLVSVLGGQLWLQIAVFLILSLITLIIARPLAAKYLSPKVEPTNFDRIIGREAVVTEEIDNLKGRGLVSVSGSVWTARSQEGSVIPAGTTVTVLRIEGVKVFVTPAVVTAQI